MKHLIFRPLPALLLIMSLVLGACSLAEDITPPPNYTPPPENYQQGVPTPSGPSYPTTPPDPVQGAEIFAQNCAPCHGTTGLGDGPQAAQLPNPPAALGSPSVARTASLADWYNVVTQGRMSQFMPPFTSLSNAQRWDVTAYALTLSTDPNELAQGSKLFSQNCARCHGNEGKGDGPDAAGLKPAVPDLTNPELISKLSSQQIYQTVQQGKAPAMPAFSQLSDQDLWALADYTRSIQFAPVSKATSPQTTVQPVTGGGTPVAQATAVAPTESGAGTPVAQSTQSITTTQTVTGVLGTISGQIVNGSGGQVPPDLTVFLHGFDANSTTQIITATTTAKTDGSYSFDHVELVPGRTFVTSTTYKNTPYPSDPATIASGTKSAKLDINIYDTTTDTSTISADRLHIFFDFSNPGTVQVVELYILSNSGKKTVVASKSGEPVTEFYVPPSATNLQFQDGVLGGGRYIQTANGFGDAAPVLPGSGQYQVLYAYDMTYTGKLDLSEKVNFPVNAVVALLPEDGVQIKSSQLSDAGTQNVQGTIYRMYNGNPIPKGGALTLTLSGSASGSSLTSTISSNSMVIGLGALGITLVLAGLFLYRRNRVREEEWEEDEDEFADLPPITDREGLMDAIIALDDQYKEGKIPDEAYHLRRDELKDRLRSVAGQK